MLRAIVLLLLLALPSGSDTRTAANNFAIAYNRWLDTLQVPSPHTINSKEILAWKEVKTQWKILDKAIQYKD